MQVSLLCASLFWRIDMNAPEAVGIVVIFVLVAWLAREMWV